MGQCICRLRGVPYHLRIHIDDFKLQVSASSPGGTGEFCQGVERRAQNTIYISAFATGFKSRLHLNELLLA
jgi:hypothetical protein